MSELTTLTTGENERGVFVQEPKWLYRFESVSPFGGLWYNDFNEWVFEKGMGTMKDSPSVALPMDYDPRYQKDGKNWHSSAPNKEMMRNWFREEDVAHMLKNGFVLYSYLATQYIIYEYESCFIKETCITRKILDPYEPFKD